MNITLDTVSKGSALPTTSLAFDTGTVTVVGAETAQRPTVLGLIASGRMAVDTGTVLLDGRPNGRALRAAIALVDAPTVAEPNDNVILAGVVAEELMFAGRPGNHKAVSRALADLDATDYARVVMADVPPAVRLRVLVELALQRPGVQGIVLTSPDRHGGAPSEWIDLADEVAERGYAVLVIVGEGSLAAVPARMRPVPRAWLAEEPDTVASPELVPSLTARNEETQP